MAGIRGSAKSEWRKHWPLVAATTAGMSLASLLSSVFGVMLEPLEQEFGWTRTEISSGPALVSIMGLFLATPAGFLIDRLGARRCGILVVVLSCVSILLMSAIGDSLWHWWGAWAVFGICAAFTSTVWLSPVSTIFHAGRGMAIAITISGTGISMALAPGIAEYFVQNHGWRAGFMALALIWFVGAMPLVFAFVPKAESHDDGDEGATGRTELVGLTGRQGFASPVLYMLFFASLLSAMTGVAIVLNLVPVLTFTGLSRAEAITIVGSMGAVSIVGRLIGGWLMDRYDVRRLAFWASLVSLAFPLLLLFLPGMFWAAFIGVMAFGLTGGMKMNAIVYLVSTHLGQRGFGLFYGMISITTTVAQGIGPLIANYVYDTMHSYTPVLWAAIPGFLGAGLLFLAMGPAPDFTGEKAPPAPPA